MSSDTVTFAEALRLAQHDAMAEDDSIVLLGQDIVAGFPFGATGGLADAFGTSRVRNTPISEAATMGCGVGAAIMGLRPVVEVDFAGFGLLGLDQLVNNGAKLRYMSDGQLRVPLVVRMGQGPLSSFGAQHSQSLHGLLAGVPGLAVLAPATPQAAYDDMRWALRQHDPVVLAEDLRLYRTRGPLQRGAGIASAPAPVVVRDGEDVTVVGYGHGVHLATEAAERLDADGISVQVVDLRALSPFHPSLLAPVLRTTRRAVCVADDSFMFGVAAALAAAVTAEAFDVLQAPVAQLSARHVPVPYAPELERLVYPDVEAVVDAVQHTLAWRA